jgi:pimeloyl-ACP methyl ester carboxylesterase
MTQVIERSQKSTTVRMFSAPPPIRATFWLLDRIAPAVSARWAERLWFTLPRPDPRHRRRQGTGDGERFSLNLDGRELVGEVWGDGPPVYLVHGWAGHRGQLTPFVAPLVAQGHKVVAFDGFSHGDSAAGAFGPRSSSIPELASALTRVVAAYGPAHAIVAHSMGATAAAVALCDGLRAHRVVMLAPMASPASNARQLAIALGFGERTLRQLSRRVERRVGAPMHHFDVPELGRAVAMPPTLIVHDRDDNSTPVTDGAAIAAAWPGARLHVTSGLSHRRVLSDPDVVAEVVEFVTA